MKKRKKLTESELRYLSEAILNEGKKIDPNTSKLLYSYTGELNNLKKTIEWLEETNACRGYNFSRIYNAVMEELPRAERIFNSIIR